MNDVVVASIVGDRRVDIACGQGEFLAKKEILEDHLADNVRVREEDFDDALQFRLSFPNKMHRKNRKIH